MSILTLLCLLLLAGACACFGVAAFARNQPRVNLVALGLLLATLVPLLQMLVRVAD